MKEKVSISWSGGKDSAFALYNVLSTGNYDIVSLHTVLNAETGRVGMHGVHEKLIETQAERIGIPLIKLYLEPSEDHDVYTSLISEFFRKCKKDGIDSVVFGDIFLQDLKAFRDKMLLESGLKGIYPLWNIGTRVLLEDFMNVGFVTVVCSANAKYFDGSVMGRTLDQQFIDSLPTSVDPCGENGEFHTFVIDGPIFRSPIQIQLGSVVEKRYDYKITDKDGQMINESASFRFQDISLSE